jgi:hypothetical protein
MAKQYDMRIQPAGVNWNGPHHDADGLLETVRLGHDSEYGQALLLGYVFKHQEYPWVQNYMAYNPNGWSGRGIEFATQPFDLPHREMVELGKMFDTSVYRWLPAKGKDHLQLPDVLGEEPGRHDPRGRRPAGKRQVDHRRPDDEQDDYADGITCRCKLVFLLNRPPVLFPLFANFALNKFSSNL